MNRRVLLLVLSVVVAAVGTGLIAVYVKGADDRAAGDQRRVEVLVASQAITTGTTAETIAGTAVAIERIPEAIVPTGAFTGPGAAEKFRSVLAGSSAAISIPQGQPIVGDFFVGGKSDNESSGVPEDKMGVVLAMGNPDRAIGLIQPGRDVTVFGIAGPKIQILIPKARVIAVDSQTAAEGNGSSGDQRANSTVSMAVTVDESMKLVLAKQRNVTLYMGVPGTKLSADDLRRGKTIEIDDVMTS